MPALNDSESNTLSSSSTERGTYEQENANWENLKKKRESCQLCNIGEIPQPLMIGRLLETRLEKNNYKVSSSHFYFN